MIVSRGKEIDFMKFPRVIFSGRRGECLLYYRATKRKAEKQLLPFAGGGGIFCWQVFGIRLI